ncbi:hypothetical protein GVO57_04530 [Sphingomonas changnyeongensis]|uniref:Tetratricopeptide repeat protein n=1 Tax=Sphingomonas changnyeongensis TaxID=2698679 RepID=A0A7Z2S826_9SPHN|nr:hypothetical protein [Sphingomonas changnyeongensis]QHL90237.1 hypothetical protein GVO57_04530 [Sphingomonas changnyeongensis]
MAALNRAPQIILVAGLAVLAWQAVAFGVGIGLRRSAPVLAARFAPDNALVLGRTAQYQLKDAFPEAIGTARRALRRDPTSAAAAGALSMAFARQGQIDRSAAMLEYSQAISRRDLPTQLWAIELAVQRNDIGRALGHYDIALRVGKNMPTILFPILASAAADPAIRAPLARMLAAGTPWKNSFLDYLSAQTQDLSSASQLVDAVYRSGGTVRHEPIGILVQRLAEKNDVAAAWRLYRLQAPRAQPIEVRNGDFNETLRLPTIFDWRLEDSGDARAEILRGTDGGELHLEARVGAGSMVASQRLLLPPGRFALEFKARPAEGATLGTSKFAIICVPSGQNLAETKLASGGRSVHAFAFSVPAGCPSQSLLLTAQSESMGSGVDGAVDGVRVRRVAPPNALQ